MFRVLILIVSIGAGGLAAWMSLAMSAAPATVTTIAAAAPKEALHEVLVLVTDTAQGQSLTKENMRWQAWPDGAFNPAFIARETRPSAIDTLPGMTLRIGMIAGEPIRDDKLTSLSAGGLSSLLPKGTRAVAVRISAENTAGGFILPNDRVDVLRTVSMSDKEEGPRESSTRTILTNITVLAIDQNLDEKKRDLDIAARYATIGKTATLKVNLAQAEILAAAEASGTLSLALRSTADDGDTTQPVVERPQSTRTVVVLRGGTIAAPKAP